MRPGHANASTTFRTSHPPIAAPAIANASKFDDAGIETRNCTAGISLHTRDFPSCDDIEGAPRIALESRHGTERDLEINE